MRKVSFPGRCPRAPIDVAGGMASSTGGGLAHVLGDGVGDLRGLTGEGRGDQGARTSIFAGFGVMVATAECARSVCLSVAGG
jgi:hypothetical protein